MISIKLDRTQREPVRLLEGYKKYKKLYILKQTKVYAVSKHYPVKGPSSFVSVNDCLVFRTLKALTTALRSSDN